MCTRQGERPAMPDSKPRITVEEFRGLWPPDLPFMQFYRFAV